MELELKVDADAPEAFRHLVIDLRDAMAGPDGIQPGGLCVTASSLLAARLARDGHPAWVILARYAPMPDSDRDHAHAYVRCGDWALDVTREQFAHVQDCGEPDNHTLLLFRAGVADEFYRPWEGDYRARAAWDLEVVHHLRDGPHAAEESARWLAAVGLDDLVDAATAGTAAAPGQCECCLEPAQGRVVRASGDEREEVEVCARHARQAAGARRAVAPVGRNDPCLCGSRRKYKRCCGT